MARRARIALLLAVCAACSSPEGAQEDAAGDGTPEPPAGAADRPSSRPQVAPAAREPGRTDPAAAWTGGPLTGGAAGAVGTLAAVRVARHEDYDRVVFDFAGDAVPGYRISAVNGGAARCGSGEPVRIEAPYAVEVSFEPARAHTDEGAATVTERSLSPRLPLVRTLEITCDYEAHVTWLIELAARPVMRASVLTGPSRLVLDFAAAPPR